MHTFLDKLFVLLLFCIKLSALQKPNVDNRRHDVYIAGFFPFGRGVENSNTGTRIVYTIIVYRLTNMYNYLTFTLM